MPVRSTDRRRALTGLYRDGETSFDGFPKIETKLIHRLALRGAAVDGGDFGPEAAFFGFVNDGL